MKLAWCTSYKL